MQGVMSYDQYWLTVNEWRSVLQEGEIFAIRRLPSDDDDEGQSSRPVQVIWVNRDLAARTLAAGKHRLATPEEVEEWRVQDAARGKAIRDEAARTAGGQKFIQQHQSVDSLLAQVAARRERC